VSKPTISYHIKILAQAGLVSVRKEGRYFFYRLERQTLRDLVDELWVLVPERVEHPEHGAAPWSLEAPATEQLRSEAALLTW